MDKPHSDSHPHWSSDDGAIPSLNTSCYFVPGFYWEYTENFLIKKSRILECLLVMKVGSVLSSHFKNLSTSFLGLLLVLCNSLCVNCISSIFINIGRPRNFTTHTITPPTQLKIIEIRYLPQYRIDTISK